jgi:hypothetical protein
LGKVKELDTYLAEAMNKPFAWGKNDCCTFACDFILIIKGVDPMKKFRGKYKTKLGAYKKLKELFGGGLAEASYAISKEMKLETVTKNYIQRGDVALCQSETVIGGVREILGIVSADGKVWIPGKEKLERIDPDKILMAWRV